MRLLFTDKNGNQWDIQGVNTLLIQDFTGTSIEVRPIKVKTGDTLIAINPCTMNDGSEDALTKGKSYKVISIYGDKIPKIVILNDLGKRHKFLIANLHKYFVSKQNTWQIEVVPQSTSQVDTEPTSYNMQDEIVWATGLDNETLREVY